METTTVTAVRDVLLEARRLINDVGFCKGHLVWRATTDNLIELGHVMAYCTVGAIDAACKRLTGDDGYPFSLVSEVQKVFRMANSLEYSIPDWNDAPERSKNDVLSAFSVAIAACEP